MFENNNIAEDKQVLNSGLPVITDNIKDELVKYVATCWDKSIEARKSCNKKDLTEKIARVLRADRCEHPEHIKKKPKDRTKVYLPWVRKAHLVCAAYLRKMLLSGSWKQLEGKTEEDQKSADYLTKKIDYLFEKNPNFQKALYDMFSQFTKKGMTVGKVYWKTITTYQWKYSIDELGQQLQNKVPVNLYNDIALDYVDIDDFQAYPTWGDFREATKIHRTKKKYIDLLANKQNYLPGSLERLESKYNQYDNSMQQSDIEVKECWIHKAVVSGQAIDNCIITIADDVLLSIVANPYDYGICPFLWSGFNYEDGSMLATGLCYEAIDLQELGNLTQNMIVDGGKKVVYPVMFTPASLRVDGYTTTPGGFWPVPDQLFEKNMLPRPVEYNLSGLTLTYETLAQIKAQFDAMTVPDILKGIRPERDETATRDMLVSESAQDNMNLPASNINNDILKPLIQFIYVITRQHIQTDMDARLQLAQLVLESTEKIQQPKLDQFGEYVLNDQGQPITEEIEVLKEDDALLAELGDLIPLERINITINGYETNYKKLEKLKNIQTMEGMVANFASPEISEILNQESLLRDVLQLLELNVESLLKTKEEVFKAKVDQLQEDLRFELIKNQMLLEAGLVVNDGSQQPVNSGGM